MVVAKSSVVAVAVTVVVAVDSAVVLFRSFVVGTTIGTFVTATAVPALFFTAATGLFLAVVADTFASYSVVDFAAIGGT